MRDGLILAAFDWEGPEHRPPILCLPGICRTALDFAGLAARHAGERRVVAIDYIGHGESARAADPRRYTPEAALRDVLDAMAALHLHRVALVGTSFGGMLAMGIAILRPGSLARVALNDVGPRLEPMGRDTVIELVGRDPAFADLDAAAAYMRERLPPLGFAAGEDEGWRAYAARSYAEGADGRYHPRWDIRLVNPETWKAQPLDLWTAFGGLAATPLMLVHGGASDLLSTATVTQMVRARPDLRLVTLPGVGHAPVLEDAVSVPALDAFLREAA
jgi:pimeloyl-ACP methyl ester carboxylesterase